MGHTMADVEVGQIYEGRVAKLMDFGALVTILPGKDGLVHISEISDDRVERVSDKLNEGDIIRVKVLEVDYQGRIRLSMRSLDAAPGNTDHHFLSIWERFRTRLLKAVFWGGVTALAFFIVLNWEHPGYTPLSFFAGVWVVTTLSILFLPLIPGGWGNGGGGNGGG